MHRSNSPRHALFAVTVSMVAVAACTEEPAPISFDNTVTQPTTPVPGSVTAVVDVASTGTGSDVTNESPTTAVVDVASTGTGSDVSNGSPTTAADAATGSQWTTATGNLDGLESECGNMSYLSVRPGRDELIAGIALQGLWSSTDGGQSWTSLGHGGGSAVIENRPSSIVYDPDNGDVYWESGLYNEGGIYRTDDGGVTFQPVGDITHSDLVALDFTDPERRTMLSGRHEEPTLLRSVDGGATWVDISASLPADIGYAAAPMVINANVHLLGTRAGTLSGILRTVDGGATWEEVFAGGVAGPPLVASDGTISWLRENGDGVVRSDDLGVTWEAMGGTGVSFASSTLIELPDGRFATFGASNQVVVSTDHGASWTAVGPALPYEPTGITYSPEQQAFYAWRFVCNLEGPNPIVANSIMRLDFSALAEG